MNLLTNVGVREGRDKNDFKVSVWQLEDELSLYGNMPEGMTLKGSDQDC